MTNGISTPEGGSITFYAKWVAKHDVAAAAGQRVTHDTISGATTQNDLSRDMTAVTFEAAECCYFPVPTPLPTVRRPSAAWLWKPTATTMG